MLTEFWSMWDGHVGRINILSHCVELPKTDSTATFRPISRWSKSSRIRKGQIRQDARQNTVEPSQNKRAGLIVFFYRKVKILLILTFVKYSTYVATAGSTIVVPINRLGGCMSLLSVSQYYNRYPFSIDASRFRRGTRLSEHLFDI